MHFWRRSLVLHVPAFHPDVLCVMQISGVHPPAYLSLLHVQLTICLFAGESSHCLSNGEVHSLQGQNGTAETSAALSRANGETQSTPRHDTAQPSCLTPSRRPASAPEQTPTQAQTPAQPSSGRSARTHTRSANKLAESGASAPTTRSAAHHAHIAAQKDSAHASLMHGLNASEAQAAVAALAMLHSSPHRLCTTPSKEPAVGIPASTLFVPSTGPLLVRSDGTTVQLDPSMLERIMAPSNGGMHYDWARVVSAGPPSSSAQQQNHNPVSPFIQVLSNADAQAIAALQELGAGHGDSSSRSNGSAGLGMARVLTAVPGNVAGAAYVRTFFF
jgi:hypothetical protein